MQADGRQEHQNGGADIGAGDQGKGLADSDDLGGRQAGGRRGHRVGALGHRAGAEAEQRRQRRPAGDPASDTPDLVACRLLEMR